MTVQGKRGGKEGRGEEEEEEVSKEEEEEDFDILASMEEIAFQDMVPI